jgi:hypothetical protein
MAPMKLLNVRLSAEDAAMAAALRRQGLEVSGIVREAIRAKYLETMRGAPADVSESLERIYSEHPDAAEIASAPSVLDRRAFREHVRARLKRHR